MDCPIQLNSKYNVSGKRVFLDIVGKGDFGITAENVKINVEARIVKETGDDRKEYWRIIGHQHSFDPIDKVAIKITGLFDGDEKKATPVLQLINVNSRMFMVDFGKPFFDHAVDNCLDNINQFFSAISANELKIK